MNLTPRQHEIVEFIRDYVAENDYAPTMREMADHLGVSRPTVFEHIEALEARGALSRQALRSRGIELAPELSGRATALPLVGLIAAGSPIEAIEDTEVLDLEELFQGRAGETFVLRVRGDSMIDEQIRDGDYVIVEKRNRARNGETVVALLEDGRGRRRDAQEVLQGKRPHPPPARQPGDEAHLHEGLPDSGHRYRRAAEVLRGPLTGG